MSNKNKALAFLFAVVLLSLNFFDAKFALTNNVKYARIGGLSAVLLLSAPFFFIKSKGLTIYIQVIIVSILVSMYMAHYSWQQSYLDSFKTTIPVLMWGFYFYLLKRKTNITWVENLCVGIGIVFMLLFLFQYANYHTVYFGYLEEFKEDRGVVRVMFAGGGFFNLSIFIALNKITTSVKNRAFWLSVFIGGLIITLLQVTRQNIAAVLIISVYHLMKKQSVIKKLLVGFFLLLFIYPLLLSDNEYVNKLFNQTDANNTVGGNIRLKAADYFLSQHYQDDLDRVLGNGIPYGEGTKYGLYQKSLVNKGFYYTDIGLVSFYIFFGIFALLALTLLYLKSFTIQIPKEYMYLKYYVFFLVCTALTSDSCYNYDFLITNVLVFYLIQYFYLQKKEGIRVMVTTSYS